MKLLMENWRQYLNEDVEDVNIFFDMDGVLVDFAGKVSELINSTIDKKPDEFYADSKPKRKTLKRLQKALEEEGRTTPVTSEELKQMTAKKDAGQERTNVEKRISDYLYSLISNNPQVWADMGILPGAKEMVTMAQNLGNVYILTSPVDEASAVGKKQWLSNHLPGIDSEKVIITREKGTALQNLDIIANGGTAVLIDDRSKYLEQFEKAGGETIHHSAENISNTLDFLRTLE